MEWANHAQGKRRPLRAAGALAGVILLLICVPPPAKRRTPGPEDPLEGGDVYAREYGCGVHVEVRRKPPARLLPTAPLRLTPTPSQRIRGQEVVWELPRRAPVGIVLFAHGCHHSAGDLWPPSRACPACLGLPEERRLRAAALRRRLALVAVSSLDRTGKRCWAEARKDGGTAVAAILRDWTAARGLGRLPLYAMGASSGGQMALALPKVAKEIKGVYAQVRGVADEALALPGGRRFPPTAFVHMPKDADNAAVIEGNIATLKAAGTMVLEVKIGARAVTAAWLAARSPLIDGPTAAAVVAALQGDGLLAGNGSVTEPPRPVTARWGAAVSAAAPGLDLTLDESHLGELLNLAWAKHELASDEAEAVLTWLQGGGRGGLDAARAAAAAEAAAVWGDDSGGDECPPPH